MGASGERVRSGRQNIGVNDFKARIGAELGSQVGYQVGIDFDSHHAGGALQQLFGESAAARSDFDHNGGGSRTRCNGNAFQ